MNNTQALIQAIALTDEILELLDADDFNRIEKLEATRQPLIKQAFTESIHQLDQIKAKHLQKLNQQVVSKLSLFRESVLTQHAQLRNATKATKAYRELNVYAKGSQGRSI